MTMLLLLCLSINVINAASSSSSLSSETEKECNNLGITFIGEMQPRTYEKTLERSIIPKCVQAKKEKHERWLKAQEGRKQSTDFKCFTYSNDNLTIGGTLVKAKKIDLTSAEKKYPVYVHVRDGKGMHNEFNPWNLFDMYRMSALGFIAVGSHHRGGEFSDGKDEYYEDGAVSDVAVLIQLVKTWPAVDSRNICMGGDMRGATVALSVDRVMPQGTFCMIVVRAPITDIYKKMSDELSKKHPFYSYLFGEQSQEEHMQKHGQTYKAFSPVEWPDQLKTALLIINAKKGTHVSSDEQCLPFIEKFMKEGNHSNIKFVQYEDAESPLCDPGSTIGQPMAGETTKHIIAWFMQYRRS